MDSAETENAGTETINECGWVFVALNDAALDVTPPPMMEDVRAIERDYSQ